MAEWETDWSRDVLERIAALLFSLAGLADIAAGLPALRRRHVLGILNHGEAEARAFLIGSGAPVSADAPETAGDAKRLAARLRALALLLCALLMQTALPGVDGSRADPSSHEISGPAVRRAPAPPASDTS